MNERQRIGLLVERFAGGAPGSDRLVVPSGDDAAVARPAGDVVVTSVDAAVDGVHFRRETWPPEAIARKAVGAALSDLAAMGAEAGEIYVACGLPLDFGEEDFEGLAAGIEEIAGKHGATVAGGDLVRAGELWLSVTVTGYAKTADAVVTRDGAHEGEVVVVTGDFGGAVRALELIEAGQTQDAAATAKQFAPQPRLACGLALAASGATAMIDVSDGLAADARQLGELSGVELEIELASLPLAAGIDDPVVAAASGEEYELLATLPEARIEEATRRCLAEGVQLTQIGRSTAGRGATFRTSDGGRVEIAGFDHFD
jgi:thiamine-monophosphate kinase